MNKTAIKNFAIWARNKLIADISYRAGLMGITADGIHKALPQSTGQTEFYDIGTAEPYAISGEAIRQRDHLVELIRTKEKDTDYKTAYKYIIEEVAYTWFNRLIAVRFMEVNDYLPSHIRVLSSEYGKIEPDLVTTPFDADLDFAGKEQQTIIELKNDNKLDEVFRLLFIKQCNALNEILPELFEKTDDYTELLLNLSVIDQDGVVYHLVNDIPEEDFDIARGGQVEIIGWLYQYYNTELNEQVYDGNMSKDRIPKELVPAATTIYTPDWPIHYMVENSLGRMWIEGHPNESLKINWRYYLNDAEQERKIVDQLSEIRKDYESLSPENIKVIDPCMGSGHILVYAFDVLMQIYESTGYGQRDAARSILKNNLYGLDIDDRAFQISYFAVMMKAREYNRRILNGKNKPNLYSIHESNGIDRSQLQYLGKTMETSERKAALQDMSELMDSFLDAKEYGSILIVKEYNWERLERFVEDSVEDNQITLESMGLEKTIVALKQMIGQGRCLSEKYHVVITNPPYLRSSRFSPKLDKYVKKNYQDVKTDLSMVMYKHATSRLLKKNGFISFITTSSWLTLSSFEKLRNYQIKNMAINSLVDFGTELFEGKVGHNPIVSWVSRKCSINYRMTAVRLVEYCYAKRNQKEQEFFNSHNHYYSLQSDFKRIAGIPIAYWISEAFFNTFKNPPVSTVSDSRCGMNTGDNDKMIRLWTEVDSNKIYTNAKSTQEFFNSGLKYAFYNKGGAYRKWYGNIDYVIKFDIENYNILLNQGNHLPSRDRYFQECITWTDLSTKGVAFRFEPCGTVFDGSAATAFGEHDVLIYLLGLLNTKYIEVLSKILNPSMHFKLGDFNKIPYLYHKDKVEIISECVLENIELSKIEWDSFETSIDFSRHPILMNTVIQEHKKSLYIKKCFDNWSDICKERFHKVKLNEEKLNAVFHEIYGLQNELSAHVADEHVTLRKADLKRDIKSLLSYAVGCMFGRYSLDIDGIAYAGGKWDGAKYHSFKPDYDNIIPITDEEYMQDDIVSRLCDWICIVFGKDTLEENLNFIARSIGNSEGTSRAIIRKYFLNDFFKDHCSVYTVGVSGKRPIYWLFDSGKQNGFKALVYLHRYNADTIGNLRIDYLHRMQRIYESEIGRMQDMIDHSTNAREAGQATKRRDKLTKQLKECREYDEKLAHLALSRIELDLDDGVKVNYRKVQTANDGKFYEVLADSKNIMVKK